ncbi:MAG TPA: PD-(D/E)XK motif protein [Terracidiphilus sp.]|nr:PD-(D/E)XK motif protein [Terracidiphilus sp.]
MKTRIEEVWDEIGRETQSRPIAEGSYKLRRVDPDFRFSLFAGLDSLAYVMLAIGVTKPPPALTLDSGSLDYFRQQRNDGTWLMALRLRQLGLSGVFGRLCQDLVDAMLAVSDEEALVALFRDRLTLWQKLFDNGSGGLLEPFQVKGMIAELLVLEAILLDGTRSPLEAVTAWVGPTGADQDFQFLDEAIEVKAVSPGADSISISSLQQLDALVPIRVRVCTMRSAAPDEVGTVSLNSLVPRVEGHLAASPEALSLFKGRLLEGGYVENPHYDTIVFQPTASEEFRVTEDSPKLVTASVPTGVISANYALALQALRKTD